MTNLGQALTSIHLTNSCVSISSYSSKALVANLVVFISPLFFLHLFNPVPFYHFRRYSKTHRPLFFSPFCLFGRNYFCLLNLDHADLLLYGNNLNLLYFWKEPWMVVTESLLHLPSLGYWNDSFIEYFDLCYYGFLYDLQKWCICSNFPCWQGRFYDEGRGEK